MWIQMSDIWNFISETQNNLLSTRLRKFFSAFPFRCSIFGRELGIIAGPLPQLLPHSYIQYLAIGLMLYSQALLSREQTGYNLMVRGQDCRLDEVTLSNLLLWWQLCWPTLCVAELHRRRTKLQTLFCGRNPTKAWIQNS